MTAGAIIAAAVALTTLQAQIPGRNVNMVSGTTWPEGDPFLQRQNEPSLAASTRNPLHLLGGSNDYRTVDLPGIPGAEETGDAWLGLFKSVDGGQRWISTLLPGFPQDQSPAGLASPLKGYAAGADAVVRAGTNGLFYYSGLAFDRNPGGKSGVFVTRFIDNNNKENGDPMAYLGTTMVAKASGNTFLDKPWLAVDVPRPSSRTCTVTADNILPTRPRGWRPRNRRGRPEPPPVRGTQRIKAGAAYVAYTAITGEGASLKAEIFLTRSVDCGTTWSAPIRVSAAEDRVNQGASVAIDPVSGAVYVSWRRFATTSQPDNDAVMVARLPFLGMRFDPPGRAHSWKRARGKKIPRDFEDLFEHRPGRAREADADIAEFDQGSSPFSFRTNAYPTTAVDGTGRLYLAWAQRGFASARSSSDDGDARIVMVTTRDGRTFTAPRAIDDRGQYGHQLMPSLAFAGGKLMLVYYDLRETKAETFNKYVSDQQPTVSGTRHTIDIRSAMASPGDYPTFAPSVKVSEYLMGYTPPKRPGDTAELRQLQVNAPNLPMFKQGTTPFMGDYIDVAPAPAFVPLKNGDWAFNTASTGQQPVFHAVWTDNRDVRPPKSRTNGQLDWTKYTPVTLDPNQPTRVSTFDGQSTVATCEAGDAGSRNQNIYTARITGGLLAGSPGNSKPLSPDMQRAFVVFAQNATAQARMFRMTIASQPVGGRASFDQYPLPPYTAQSPAPRTSIDLTVPARSTGARTVYVTSSDPKAGLNVSVSEIGALGATTPLPSGLKAQVMLNPDIENPDIENPDIENPDIENPDIENTEVYNPDIENPDIENPDIENPDIENVLLKNPDIENPDIENVVVVNPDIENPDIENPDIENALIKNPDIENPDIENPDIENGAITDVSWNVTNTGNTTSAFNVNMFLAGQVNTAGVKTQLIVHKVYKTPVSSPNGCDPRVVTQNILLTNILNPHFVTPTDNSVPDPNDPRPENAAFYLAPFEEAKVTLRIFDRSLDDNDTITKDDGTTVTVDKSLNPYTKSTPGVASQGVDPLDETTSGKPPIITPTGSNLFFMQLPSGAVSSQTFAPPVAVRVFDNAGTALPGVTVNLQPGVHPIDSSIAGGSAVAGPDGIATFTNLTFSTPGTYTLVASATALGIVASAESAPFEIGSPVSPLVVTNTNDSGPGSLRAAIAYANSIDNAGDVISFNIPGAPPFIIKPLTPLPEIADDVTIDATTQPGWEGTPLVGLSGELLPPDSNGLVVEGDASGSVIRGLVINNFGTANYTGGNAIKLLASNTVVEGNYIGTDMSGNGPAAVNNYTGVFITAGVINTVVGGSMPNVIAGNTQGVWVQSGTGNVINGNYIGLDATGSHVVAAINDDGQSFGNQYGVLIDGASSTTIGADVMGDANFISGNQVGILLRGGSQTKIRGNTIGLSADGMSSIANGDGISAYGSVSGTEIGPWRNVIAGNLAWGINLDGSADGRPTGTWIECAYVGLNLDGTAIPNGEGGVRLISVPDTHIGGDCNTVISGNGGPGIVVGGAAIAPMPEIADAYIGTDPDGLEARPNTNEGIVLSAPANIHGNTISGNGNAALAAGTGILILRGASGSVIDFNYIGVTASLAPLGNGYSGITVYGDVTGVTIGSDDGGNIIASNPAAGIAIYTVGEGERPKEITIAANSIHDNGGLGIDLDANGVTANDGNDADSGGANDSQNFPVLSNARNDMGPTTWVSFDTGTFLDGTYTLRFYASPTCDASGHGEGAQYLDRLDVDGDDAGIMVLPSVIPGGWFITATATDSDGSTSEFSACTQVASPGGNITAVLPVPPAASQMVTLQGSNFPEGGRAFVTQSAVTSEAFVFMDDTTRMWVRLPAGLSPGAATVQVSDNDAAELSPPFALTIAATPAAPIITGAYLLNMPTSPPFGFPCGSGLATGIPTGTISPGQGLGVAAFGTDTFGATVVFTQGATVVEVSADCASGNTSVGLWVTVTVPPGLVPGPVDIRIKQSVGVNTSPLSAPITLTVPEPPPIVVGPAGGGGGSAFSPVDCAPGSVVVGFTGRAGDDIDGTSIVCAPKPALAPPTTLLVEGCVGVGCGGTDYGGTLTCPAGSAVTGIFGTNGSNWGGVVVDTLGVRCTDLTTSATANLGPVGSVGGFPAGNFSFSCPAGKQVIGLEGRAGALLDQLSIRCR